MTQVEKALRFAALHVPGNPLVLYNIWDAGGAKAIAEAGAQAIATGSWSVAAAQGYSDGEAIPLELVLQTVSRIAASVALPLTVDFEGGYADVADQVTENVCRVIEAGAIGINFEDQVMGGSKLYSPAVQADRIGAVRKAGEMSSIPVFINARTDLFLQESDRSRHAALMAEAKARAETYEESGANSFFVPGLVDPDLIADICGAARLPVNVMMREGAPSIEDLASLGVARVSHGPGPYFAAMKGLKERFTSLNIGP